MNQINPDSASFPPVLLIHGAWHGAWCWYRTLHRLREAGVAAKAVDLPGHATDRTDRSTVTLESYADSIIATLSQTVRPSLVVAHSMGGIVASTVAQRRPDLVAGLVYVTAFMLPDGQAVGSFLEASGLSSEFFGMLDEPDADGTIGVKPGRRREIFYGESPAEDVELSRMLLTRQPARPQEQPITVTADRFGVVPKFYVQCSLDRVITPEMQSLMLSRTGCDGVYTLGTDHSPFFSRPDELHAILMQVGELVSSPAK